MAGGNPQRPRGRWTEGSAHWLAAALREELAHLGNLARFEALLTGPGALAQDRQCGRGAMGRWPWAATSMGT